MQAGEEICKNSRQEKHKKDDRRSDYKFAGKFHEFTPPPALVLSIHAGFSFILITDFTNKDSRFLHAGQLAQFTSCCLEQESISSA